VDVVRLGPGGRAEAEHHVAAEERGEEHDLRRQEQPHDQLAAGERQAGLVLERDVTVVVAMTGMTVVGRRDGGGVGVHDGLYGL